MGRPHRAPKAKSMKVRVLVGTRKGEIFTERALIAVQMILLKLAEPVK